MQIITLEHTSISDLTKCFNKAFSDYFVKFNVTEAYLQDRWYAAGVDFSLSAGVMDGGLLVGFIMNAVQEWRGLKSAFNVGTGVIPSHRGNQLTEKMYDFFLPKLIAQNIKCLGLEVIQENHKAIHIYKKVGLVISRGLNCYNGEIRSDLLVQVDGISFKEIKNPDWKKLQSFHDFE
ncbi:MAG: GNAT family N-acetyltransferase, partial [Bacteroidota bacterium]